MAQVKGLFSLFLNSYLIQKSELLSQNNLTQRNNKTHSDPLKLVTKVSCRPFLFLCFLCPALGCIHTASLLLQPVLPHPAPRGPEPTYPCCHAFPVLLTVASAKAIIIYGLIPNIQSFLISKPVILGQLKENTDLIGRQRKCSPTQRKCPVEALIWFFVVLIWFILLTFVNYNLEQQFSDYGFMGVA